MLFTGRTGLPAKLLFILQTRLRVSSRSPCPSLETLYEPLLARSPPHFIFGATPGPWQAPHRVIYMEYSLQAHS